MHLPHTVTVYNTISSPLLGDSLYCTVLRGVMLQASKGANVRDTGLEGADAANLFIPFTVDAVDGITGEGKRYVPPQEFFNAEDRSNLWTLSYNGNGGSSFFVEGEFVTDNEDTARAQDGCYSVTKVDAMNYGSKAMWHWEVGGV